jgi:hypothetical protein
MDSIQFLLTKLSVVVFSQVVAGSKMFFLSTVRFWFSVYSDL